MVRDLFTPALNRERREGSAGRDDRRVRAALLTAVGGVGRDASVVAEARVRVDQYLAKDRGVAIDATLLTTLVRLAAVGGDAVLFEKYLARAESASTPEERYRFLYALAAFSDPDVLRRIMEYALSSAVRAQDRASLVAAVLGNPGGRDVAWRMLQSRWPALQQDLGAFGGSSRVIAALGTFCDRGRADEIEAFFAAHPISDAQRTLQQTLEDIERCADLAAEQGPKLADWLAQHSRERR